jgi:hypothetical protein
MRRDVPFISGRYGVFAVTCVLVCLMGCGSGNRPSGGEDKGAGKGPVEPVFPQLDGWSVGTVKAYGPDELYGPINGEADRYIHLDLQKAWFVSYSQTGGDGIIDVQVYGMDSPESAFGIYMMYDTPGDDTAGAEPGLVKELLDEGPLIRTGEGFAQSQTGQYFIRLSEHNMESDPELLTELVSLLGSGLEGGNARPEVLALISPVPAVRGTLRYFRKWETYRELNYDLTENVLGLSGDTDGVQVSLMLDENGVERNKLFLIAYADAADAEKAWSDLSGFFAGEGLAVSEPIEGRILVSKGGEPHSLFEICSKYVYGFFDLAALADQADILTQIRRGIESSK